MIKQIKIKKENWITSILLLFYGLGAIGLDRTHSQEFFISVMPYSLVAVIGLLLWVHQGWHLRHVFVFLLIAATGYGIEVAGVFTGHVFGEYSYGSALGFKILQTPPLIGLNWLMLTYCVYVITKKTVLPVVPQILFGALLMVFYDIILEPVAIQLDMWSWKGSDIPVQNYIAWFVISLVMLTIFHSARLQYRNALAAKLFFMQICFFIALNLILFW